jgi:hypothetical protein
LLLGTTTDGEGGPPRKRARSAKNGGVKKKGKGAGKKQKAGATVTPTKHMATTGTAQRVLRTGLGTAAAPHPTNPPNAIADLPYLDMQYVATSGGCSK